MWTIGGLGLYIYRLIVGQQSTAYRSTVGRLSADISTDISTDSRVDRYSIPPSILDRYVTDTWPILDRYTTVTWPTHDRYLTDTWPIVDRYMTNSSPILDRRLTDTLATLHQNFTDTSPILGLFHDKRYKPLISGACRLRQRIPSNVFIMGYVTLSLGCCMVCCYNCFISGSLRLGYLYAFASYDHPYALKLSTQWLGIVSFS